MKKFNVLIVENEPSEQFIFHSAIQEFSANIETDYLFSTKQLADFFLKDQLLRSLNKQEIPDLVIINTKDCNLDLETLQRIKSREEFRLLPFYYFTKTKQVEDELLARNSGAAALIKLPDTCMELNVLIEDILGGLIVYQQAV